MKQIVLAFFVICGSLHADLRTDVDRLKKEVSDNIRSLEGWCSAEKAFHFIDLIIETHPKLCVEIGVFGGSSIYPVASALKYQNEGGLVVGIDAWDKIECIRNFDPIEDETSLQWWSKVNLNFIYRTYLNMIKKYQFESICKTKILTSEEAVKEFEDNSIDILYIDGNHCETTSTLDVQLYLPKVRLGGHIWFNDALWESRQQAVDLLIDHCDIIKLIDKGNCILFKKR
jgi:hypothetical protein